MAPELTYDLVARQDDETQRILDNVIVLLVTSYMIRTSSVSRPAEALPGDVPRGK